MQAASVTFVRHAMPLTDTEAPSTEWHLGHDGVEAAERLADRLEVAPRIGVLVTSSEPKAVETAATIAERWHTLSHPDERLREVARPWVGAGYRSVAHRYLRGEVPDGWEPHDEVATRAGAAVDDAVVAAEGAPVVIVSHGLLLAVLLGSRLGHGFDREAFWSCLSFPDAWGLDGSGTIHRPQLPAASS
jgi:broad specificity phosphatase PhoE